VAKAHQHDHTETILDAMALLGWRDARPDFNWDAYQRAEGPAEVLAFDQVVAALDDDAQQETSEQDCAPIPFVIPEAVETNMRMVARNGQDIPDEIAQKMQRDRLAAQAAQDNNDA
jgi:hypothetical protein